MLDIGSFLGAPDGERRMVIMRHIAEEGPTSAISFAERLGAFGDRQTKAVARTFSYLRDHKMLEWARDDRGKVVGNACALTEEASSIVSSEIRLPEPPQAPRRTRTEKPQPAPPVEAAPIAAPEEPDEEVSELPFEEVPAATVSATSEPVPVISMPEIPKVRGKRRPLVILPNGSIRVATLSESLEAKAKDIELGGAPVALWPEETPHHVLAAALERWIAENVPQPAPVAPAAPKTRERKAPAARRPKVTRERRQRTPAPVRARASDGERVARKRRDLDPSELVAGTGGDLRLALFNRLLRTPRSASELAKDANLPERVARQVIDLGVTDQLLTKADAHGRHVLTAYEEAVPSDIDNLPAAQLVSRDELIRRGILHEETVGDQPQRELAKPERRPKVPTIESVFGPARAVAEASQSSTEGDFLTSLSNLISKLRVTSGAPLNFGERKHLTTSLERFYDEAPLDQLSLPNTVEKFAELASLDAAKAKRVLDLAILLGVVETHGKALVLRSMFRGLSRSDLTKAIIGRIDSARTVGARRKKLQGGSWRNTREAVR